jgi:uncharacterized damage-inducible protein DinB
MDTEPMSLSKVFEGWEGYQLSLANTVRPLTPEQLKWRPAAHLRSVGELIGHISQGRLEWFARMQAPRSAELASQTGADNPQETLYANAAALVRHLESSWSVIEASLREWTVADLSATYRHTYNGQTYAVSRQWTIWRILTHDVHHGGEVALMLGLQGMAVPELGDMFGHLVMPPLAKD